MLLEPISSIATPHVFSLDARQSVQAAVDLMAAHGVQDIIVTGNPELRIITAQHIIPLRLDELDFSTPLAAIELPVVACLPSDASIASALGALQQSPTEYLCLVDEGQVLAGILSYTDLINHLDPRSLAETRQLKELLRLADYTLLDPRDDLKSAMQQMHAAGHSAALITLDGPTVGIITRSDVVRALQDSIDWQQPVTHFMTAPALTAREDATLQEALGMTRRHRLKRLVVVDADEQVVGLLHQKDLVALAYESLNELLRRQEQQLQNVETLYEHEQRWRAVLESTQQGVWDWNIQAGNIYFSPTWKTMLGYAEEEIGDSPEEWKSRIHPEDREATYADLERHFAGLTPLYENTHRVRCKSGQYKWILDRGKIFSRDAQGRPLRMIGAKTDVSEERAQKQKLNRLAENVPGMLYQYRLYPDGRSCFPYSNAGIRSIYGLEPEQVVEDASEFLRRLHPDDLEQVEQSIVVSANTLAIWTCQYRYQHPRKGVRWLEGHATPQRLADGSIIWDGYIYDITDSKCQQLALEETRTRFQLTMEATDTGLWTWDMRSNVITWDDQTFRQLGYAPQAFPVSLDSFQQLVHPHDLPRMMDTVRRHTAEHQCFEVQFRLRKADGDWLWVQGRGKVTATDAQGQPCFMMGTHTNVSSLKTVETALEKSRERLLLATQSANLGIWDYDAGSGLLAWDDGMFRLYGKQPEQFRGTMKDWAESLLPEERQATEAAFLHALEHLDQMALTMSIRRADDGAIRVLQCEARIIREAQGRLLRVVGINRDITEQVQISRHLEQAQAAAEAANRAKSEFLANMSHEIRTPMNGIIGLSRLSASEQPPEVLRDRLHKIQQSGNLLLGILNDILDFSRIEAGKLNIEARPFLLEGLLDNLHAMLDEMARNKGLRLLIEADARLSRAYVGDELRLRQVLVNLLGNAIKFTRQGEVRLRVSCRPTGPGEQQLRFEVLDTGIGISPEQQGRLFQAFSQADSSITRQHGGSGLGLVISQRLVQAMGSPGIELRSAPLQGSCFSFLLDLRRCSAHQEQALLASLVNREQDIPTQLQGRILLVEDNPINQEVGRAQLHELGLSVSLAANGAEALQQLEDADFDLVLMDIQMPVMDGYAATRQLRARGCTLPIIALTAAALVEDQQKAQAAGMSDHLAKPIGTRELRQVLARWLKAGVQVPAAIAVPAPAPTQIPVVPSRPAVSPIPATPPAARALPGSASANSDSSATAAGQELRCFDPDTGLQMVGGNAALQRRLIGEFVLQLVQEYRPLQDELQMLQTHSPAQRFIAAQQKAHSLKGVAGNLCLPRLAGLASALDRQLKRAQVPDAALLQAFTQTLWQSETELQQWLAAQDRQPPAASPVSGSAISASDTGADLPAPGLYAALEQLLAAIRNSEFIDEARLEQLGSQLPAPVQSHWQAVQRALDTFDFHQAATSLDQLLTDLHARNCTVR